MCYVIVAFQKHKLHDILLTMWSGKHFSFTCIKFISRVHDNRKKKTVVGLSFCHTPSAGEIASHWMSCLRRDSEFHDVSHAKYNTILTQLWFIEEKRKQVLIYNFRVWMQSMNKSKSGFKSSMVEYKSLKLGLNFTGLGYCNSGSSQTASSLLHLTLKKMKWVTDTERGGSDLMIVEIKLGQYSNPTYC